MKKRNKIIYWIATVWLSLGMVASGIPQVLQVSESVEFILNMGYPAYFLVLIGIWKILGTIVVLMPGYPILKEWAYAGFFFVATGAVFSHIAVGSSAAEYFGPCLLLLLTILSWYFRPGTRRVANVTASTIPVN